MHCKKAGYKSPKGFRVGFTMALLLVVIFVISFAAEVNFVASKNSQDDPAAQPLPDISTTALEPLEGQIRIAAFNIQIFGKAKREKPNVMAILVQIAREFDIIFVQELKYIDEQTTPIFLDAINDVEGPDYAFVRSERLGRSSSKEAYAYFYNTATVTFIEGSDYVHNDMADGVDDFERDPYIASFYSGNFDFTLVGIHVKPDSAEAEIRALGKVYFETIGDLDAPGEMDIIILGDLNADRPYFDEDDPFSVPGDEFIFIKKKEFFWVISNEMDTMVKTDWTYDRIVITAWTVENEYVQDSASAFYFDDEYGINDRGLIEDVSDHYPVYASFRTDLSDDDDSGASLGGM